MWPGTAVIIGLVAGVGFVVLFSSVMIISANNIPTHPRLPREVALWMVEDYLNENLVEILAPLEGRENERIQSIGFLESSDPDFRPVQLVFVHRNGTQFLIDDTDYETILGKCNLTDQDLCYTGDRTAQSAIKGHLIYVLEVTGQVNETIAVGGRYMVDANDGRILNTGEWR